MTRKSKFEWYIHAGFLGTTSSSVSSGCPWPSALTAETLNLYFSPSISFGTTKDVVLTSRSATLTHDLRRLSYFSSRYPVTAVPPSDAGGCHDNVTESSVMSLVDKGPVGLDGFSSKYMKSVFYLLNDCNASLFDYDIFVISYVKMILLNI